MIVKTRIQNKNDIEANWLKATNFTPLKGEVIIYNEDKIGDLTTRLSALEALLNEDGYNVVLVKNNK